MVSRRHPANPRALKPSYIRLISFGFPLERTLAAFVSRVLPFVRRAIQVFKVQDIVSRFFLYEVAFI